MRNLPSHTHNAVLCRYMALALRPMNERTTERRKVRGKTLDPFEALTPRERRVLALAAEGLTTAQIADRLGIRPSTAAGHLGGIYRKLRMQSRADLTALALQRGLIHEGCCRRTPGCWPKRKSCAS